MQIRSTWPLHLQVQHIQDRVTAVYRNQWPELNNVFVTYSFAYDHYFENFNSGVGVLLLRDVAGSGDLGILNAGVHYSYDIQINEEFHLRPGIHFNYTQQGIDFSKLQWNDELSNPGGGTIEQPPTDPYKPDVDFAASLLGYTERAWFGFSVDHLLRPNYGLYNNDADWPIKYSAFGGYQVIKKGRLLNPIDETLSLAFHFRTTVCLYPAGPGCLLVQSTIDVWFLVQGHTISQRQ